MSLHAAALDMVALSLLRFVICNWENGKKLFICLIEGVWYLGESSQVNIDHLVCKAANYNSTGLRELLIIYDINCQYLMHFEERLGDVSQYLSLDPDMEVFGAIGKFHLVDHVDSCFSKWSLNFMKGSGHIDGEIMETLWSGMNKVSGAARLMSKAHRQETLDDYMRDANWKKTVGIGEFSSSTTIQNSHTFFICIVQTLSTKLKRSQIGFESAKPAFKQLNKSCLERKLPVHIWKSDEATAMEERGEALRIFDINLELAPSLAQITLRLTDLKENSNQNVNVIHWISDGIKAQNDQ